MFLWSKSRSDNTEFGFVRGIDNIVDWHANRLRVGIDTSIRSVNSKQSVFRSQQKTSIDSTTLDQR